MAEPTDEADPQEVDTPGDALHDSRLTSSLLPPPMSLVTYFSS